MTARPAPIPLTVLTGFLGAGKTTLLNRLLADPALADTAVLVNEVGEIPLDHLLVESVGETMIALSSGCVCCAMRGELADTLEQLLRDRDNGRLPPFARLVLETTGLADPIPVLQTVLAHPYFVMRYAIEGIVTVVDAVNGAATLKAHPEAVRQVALADRIVLTKTDLLTGEAGAEALASLRARLAALNPAADLLRPDAPVEALLPSGAVRPLERLAADLDRLSGAIAPAGHVGHVRPLSMTSEAALSPEGFGLFMELLRAAHGPRLLRTKGLIRLSDDPDRPVLIQGAQAVFHPPVRLDRWPDEDRRSRLVVIADGIEPGFLDRLYLAFAGVPAIDTPDAAALAANPLSLRGGGLLG